jgi:hypothetical protein
MQIGSISSLQTYSPTSQVQKPEARETGPDRDNDGDEGAKVAATQPASQSSQTGAVDLLA